MFGLATPGVYYQHVDAGVPRVAVLATDVTGFVGIARRGPIGRAVPVDSWRQFEAWFGDYTGAGYLAYCLRAYFENGGRRAWIVRVASDVAAAAATVVASGAPALPCWRIRASSAGVWGDALAVRVVATRRAQTRTVPHRSTAATLAVESVAGFEAHTHVAIVRAPMPSLYRVVAAVDPDAKTLTLREPLPPIDPNLSLLLESIEYTVLVHADGRLAARHEGLTLEPRHARYGPAVLAGLPPAPVDERGWRVPDSPALVAIDELRDETAIFAAEPLVLPPQRTPLRGGADGLAALTTYDFVGEASSPFDSDELRRARTRGLRALESVREVSLVAVPDIHIRPIEPPQYAPLPLCVPDPCLEAPPPPPAVVVRTVGDLPPEFDEQAIYDVQAAMIAQCETLRDRVALLDAPYATASDPRRALAPIRAWRRRFESSYAALYFPWTAVSEPLRGARTLMRTIPPCGHVAGGIARSDLTVGVHAAPANAPLAWVQDLSFEVDDTQHGVLNDAGIDVLRTFPGRGIRVFGARTVASDSDWRFLNVRRLLLMIERAIGLAVQWAVFEPNDLSTRARLHLAISDFLLSLWRRGALAGKTAQASFYVRCDETLNPPSERANGRLAIEVGVAPAIPFEFVVLRVGRVDDRFEVEEGGVVSGVMR